MARAKKATTGLTAAASQAPKSVKAQIAKLESGKGLNPAPADPLAEPRIGVVESVELSLPSPNNSATHRPDLLGHPFHDYLNAHGLDGLYASTDSRDAVNVNFHRIAGWRVFHVPPELRDQHDIFHGTDGDTVQRGELVLMVRPKELTRQENERNALAYKEDLERMALKAEEQPRTAQGKPGAEATVKIEQIVSSSPTVMEGRADQGEQ